ncbi:MULTISPECIES: MerR family transcriptional regulator [Heyndrickxia]|uniref:MerR family transcriptional regulator n=1 Tax=Heyndrickxia TaxID=2837504 RepID=UPI002DC06018|nr:MerR family DNA-binding transcriptional regulator [Weizmannia sp. CD-2023]MEC2222338.1 MerR family DNA-binding transcriptional regulator [Weizmannia sp. CD-2023]
MTCKISELAAEFGVSTRTIRYYEELGLFKPKRSQNGRRCYSKKDYTRLKLIFRGKQLDFSLDEIKEMIELFDCDRSGIKQLKKTIEYGKQKRREVAQQIQNLQELQSELEKYLAEFETRLKRLKEHSC